MPEVILGLSLLLLFVATDGWIGWPHSRGIVTRLGVSPEVNALASLFLAAVFVLLALAAWLMARQQRRPG